MPEGDENNGQGGTQGGAQGGDGGKPKQSPEVQAAIDAIIARERKDAKAALEALKGEYEGRIAELTKKPAKKGEEPVDDEAFKAKIEAAIAPFKADADTAKKTLAEFMGDVARAEVKRYASELAVPDAVDLVTEALAGSVKPIGRGKFEVVDQDGKPAYGGAQGLLTVREAVERFLEGKPGLKLSKGQGGSGYEGTRKTATQDAAKAGVDKIRAQIAEAEAKQDYATAGVLKSELLVALRGDNR